MIFSPLFKRLLSGDHRWVIGVCSEACGLPSLNRPISDPAEQKNEKECAQLEMVLVSW